MKNRRIVSAVGFLGALLLAGSGLIMGANGTLAMVTYGAAGVLTALCAILLAANLKAFNRLLIVTTVWGLLAGAVLLLKLPVALREPTSVAYPPSLTLVLVLAAMCILFVCLVQTLRFQKIHLGYIILFIMATVWLFPIFWIAITSFRAEPGTYTSYLLPKHLTINNYVKLLTDTSTFVYVRWFFNTLLVATLSCLLTSIVVLSTAFTISRLRFSGRKALMNVLLILGMFPGFMAMIAVYYILKGIGLTQQLAALILVYGGGGALGYYVAKGFFDTIPKSLDEAALLDGATKWTLFTRITIPLSRPIIIYTMLVAFIKPWSDLIFAQIIMGDNYKNWTLAVGMFAMLERTNIDKWYLRFTAGAVLISIPIALLFIGLQRYYVEGLSGSVKG